MLFLSFKCSTIREELEAIKKYIGLFQEHSNGVVSLNCRYMLQDMVNDIDADEILEYLEEEDCTTDISKASQNIPSNILANKYLFECLLPIIPPHARQKDYCYDYDQKGKHLIYPPEYLRKGIDLKQVYCNIIDEMKHFENVDYACNQSLPEQCKKLKNELK